MLPLHQSPGTFRRVHVSGWCRALPSGRDANMRSQPMALEMLAVQMAFPITDALLERFLAGFQEPEGEGETVIDNR